MHAGCDLIQNDYLGISHMVDFDTKWLQEFDVSLQKCLAIDRCGAGISDEVVFRYADMSPRDAALQYGEDYDLQRIDLDWLR
jgi:hypothetical protein